MRYGSCIVSIEFTKRLTIEDKAFGQTPGKNLLPDLRLLIKALAVVTIAWMSFILADSPSAQDSDFPGDWSECDCHYSTNRGMLGCVNTADNEPRGLWLAPGEWGVVVADKWIAYDAAIIPMAYRIGTGETETSIMVWNAANNSAYSSDPELHDRLLVAISEGTRIAVKLAYGPVHIVQECHDGPGEAAKYKRMLDGTGQ